MPEPDRAYRLDDRFDRVTGRVYMTGTQALVRLMLMQSARDRAAGLNTAGLVTGYRGSPLGGVDLQMMRSKKLLDPANILFQPGLNEDLGATMVWGTQQTNLFPGAKVDGVFGMWYGKGPGVDRCGDVFKHANMAGTTPWGGVIAVAGDDHISKSSTAAHHPTKGAMIFTGVWRDSEAMPTPMPVMAVNIGWQKGVTRPRRMKVARKPSIPCSMAAMARYWMFSVKAKPAATMPA